MKKIYEKPEIEVIHFNSGDFMTYSGGSGCDVGNHGHHYGWGNPQPEHGNNNNHGHNHGGHRP